MIASQQTTDQPMNPEKSIKLSVQIPLFLLLNLILHFLDLWTNQALLCLVIDVILFGIVSYTHLTLPTNREV